MPENPTPARLDGHSFRIRTHPSVPRDHAYLIPDISGTADLDLEPDLDLMSWPQLLASLAHSQRIRPAAVAVVRITEP